MSDEKLTPEQFNRSVDFGRTATDYGRHRADFPPALFARLKLHGVGLPGQRVLDLGAGTGALSRSLAAGGCQVIALDPAFAMLREARRLADDAGSPLQPIVARSEQIPLAGGSQDVVSAGQCWHWFDRPAAAAEVRRVLIPGGRLLIAHFDWLPIPGNVVAATEELIERYNPAWHFGGGNGCHPEWLPGLGAAGFSDIETFSFDHAAPYSHEGWRGRIRASAGVAATLSVAEVQRFDAELAAILQARFPREPLAVPHRVFAIVARSVAV